MHLYTHAHHANGSAETLILSEWFEWMILSAFNEWLFYTNCLQGIWDSLYKSCLSNGRVWIMVSIHIQTWQVADEKHWSTIGSTVVGTTQTRSRQTEHEVHMFLNIYCGDTQFLVWCQTSQRHTKAYATPGAVFAVFSMLRPIVLSCHSVWTLNWEIGRDTKLVGVVQNLARGTRGWSKKNSKQVFNYWIKMYFGVA